MDASSPTGRVGDVLGYRTASLAPLVRETRTARTSDRVFEQLVAAIRDNRLEPGQRLSETDLAAQLQVSRTPLREAIARLADAGLVQVISQVSTRVSLIRLSDVEQARFVRENLEVAAFRIACELPAHDVTALRRLLAEQRAACESGDQEAFFAADEALHQQIFLCSGYPGAWQAVQRMKLQLDRLRRLSLPEPHTLRDLLAEHTSIVDALQNGDIERGSDHIRAHARRVSDQAPRLRQKHPHYFTA